MLARRTIVWQRLCLHMHNIANGRDAGQALPGWPNVLATGKRPAPAGRPRTPEGGGGGGGGGATESRLLRMNRAVRRRSAQSLLSEYVSAVWHAYKPLTRPCSTLLARWAIL